MGRYVQRVLLLIGFGLKKGIDLDLFSGLRKGIFFFLAWHWLSSLQGTIILFYINTDKFKVTLKFLHKQKPFLVSYVHISKLCTNFRGLAPVM